MDEDEFSDILNNQPNNFYDRYKNEYIFPPVLDHKSIDFLVFMTLY